MIVIVNQSILLIKSKLKSVSLDHLTLTSNDRAKKEKIPAEENNEDLDRCYTTHPLITSPI